MCIRDRHKGLEGFGAIEVHPIAGSRHAKAGQQARQAEDVVSVHVGDEDAPQLRDPQLAAKELVLGAFTAVE